MNPSDTELHNPRGFSFLNLYALVLSFILFIGEHIMETN